MLKIKLIHGFQILNHVNMLMPWFFMILKSIKNCKIFRISDCLRHDFLNYNSFKCKNDENNSAGYFKIF